MARAGDATALSWETINKYVGYVRPVLHTWQTKVGGFREIDREHVTLAIKQREGNIARGVHVGTRSLFRALKLTGAAAMDSLTSPLGDPQGVPA